jgi:exosome complex component RRP40
VVGVVVERHAENFVVDIGAPFPAVLNVLAFEGATRRNRPKLAEGDLVYARVVLAHRDIDTELACVDAGGKVCILLHGRQILCNCLASSGSSFSYMT